MGTIVNLRQHRKRQARADKAKAAAQNRLTFGRTKAERQAAEMEQAAEKAIHEGHRLRNEPDSRPGSKDSGDPTDTDKPRHAIKQEDSAEPKDSDGPKSTAEPSPIPLATDE